jgi:S-formylglutathione hydrolase FrmB
MRNRNYRAIPTLVLAAVAGFFVAGCGGGGGQVFERNVPAASIRNSMFDDPVDQPVAVYLPPSYVSSSKRYPAVYVLPDFASPVTDYLDGTYQGFRLAEAMDRLIEEGTVGEMIVVVVNGRSFLGGSFYTNSPVTGNWGDFVTRDVVRYIDNNYKTLPYPQSRGVTGYGMGGSGALDLAMRHPDTFGSVYAVSPSLFDNQGLRLHGMFGGAPIVRRLIEWKNELAAMSREEAHEEYVSFIDGLFASGTAADTLWAFSYAYGSAFSPDPESNAPYIKYPHTIVNDRISLNATTWWQWDSGYGAIRKKLEEFGDNFRELNAIVVDVGDAGPRRWILDGCAFYAKRLQEIGVDVDLVTHGGDNEGHHLRERIEGHVFPYFTDHLVFE